VAERPEIFRHEAMATTFEIRISGAGTADAGGAARTAFSVIDRMERLLSRFVESSDISRINALRPGETALVSPETLDCLEQALRFQEMTLGAFDPSLGAGGRILMDRDALLIGVEDAPVSLDLGAIGKGFALDLAAAELGDWDIGNALLVSGGSSVLALGAHGGAGWEVSLGGVSPARRLFLRDYALGGSGTAVKGEHILDPRTGARIPAGRRTWALAATAAAADALSTAWMILSPAEIQATCSANPGTAAILQDASIGSELWTAGLASCAASITAAN
jgi:FAD:protein FMN transferase